MTEVLWKSFSDRTSKGKMSIFIIVCRILKVFKSGPYGSFCLPD